MVSGDYLRRGERWDNKASSCSREGEIFCARRDGYGCNGVILDNTGI